MSSSRDTGSWKPRNKRSNQCVRFNGKPKVAHGTHDEARTAAESLTLEKGEGRITWSAYRCPDCAAFHVGRQQTAYARSNPLRWAEAWEMELGVRASTLLRAESLSPLAYIAKAFKSAERLRAKR